jgi:hypothetical protein
MTGQRRLAVGLLALAVVAIDAAPFRAADEALAQKPTATASYSAKELQAFARAAREVFAIRQAYAPRVQSARSEIDARDFIVAAEKEMSEAIGRQGMTVARYNEILKAAQRDPALAARIQSFVDKAADGR